LTTHPLLVHITQRGGTIQSVYRLFVKLSYRVVRRVKEEFKNFRLSLVHDLTGIVHSVQKLRYGLGHEISFFSMTFSPALDPIQPFI
jgi:hypothetical protein